MTNSNIKIPTPSQQRIGKGRVKLIIYAAVAAAVALTIFDAKVSLDGFRMMDLPQYVPMVLTGLVFVTQLCTGALQQLGMNPFYGVGGSSMLDFVWRWILSGIYIIDIGSNAVAFKVQNYLTYEALRFDPVNSIVMVVVLLLFATLLTFGDEILLRQVDRLVLGSKSNEAAAKKLDVEIKAYNRYLKGYEVRAIDQADVAGQNAIVNYEWLKEHTE